ncbi:MAG: hypothetical protein PHP64_05050 [Actinomycetota bacterium]|nr:hypothetical protein [Actinomycetota bacterium]
MGFESLTGLNIWVFNVEHGLASAIRTPNGKWILIDLGSSGECNPLTDFILPSFERIGVPLYDDPDCETVLISGKCSKAPCLGFEKMHFAQLILSHPHTDHLAGIKTLCESAFPILLTSPHSNEYTNGELEMVNWEIVKEQNRNAELVEYLEEEVLPLRRPPNRPTNCDDEIDYMQVYWIPPKICEDDEELSKQNYTNNLSLLVFLKFGASSILFCGDIMPDGVKVLIDADEQFGHDVGQIKPYRPFKQILKEGIDVLVVPHHGLESGFSTDLFSTMKNPEGKVRSINIISKQSGKDVDSRYSSSDYCEGRNNLGQRSKSTTDHLLIRFPKKGERNCEVLVGNDAISYFEE